MPFNIWCGGCNAHIGKGVRYNAEKKCVGNYFSTKIYSFRMKCHLCPNYIEIETDPKNTDYVVKNGASKKTEEWEGGDENQTENILQEDEAQKLAEDPFYKLEQDRIHVDKVKELAPVLADLQDFNETRKDDFALNQLLRKGFRTKKKELDDLNRERERKGLSIDLLPHSQTDTEEARTIKFKKNNDLEAFEKKRRVEMKSSSIFGNNKDTLNVRKAKIAFATTKKQSIF
eukprot:TRINITY_DN1048_c0_g1_i1.p1 TRINITY_DN1048_c0_g1~~TRINITY_DN1048_c0_g1_i1.p1  ORF type:complete len:230 (+),score=65.55 TRINITY_DN1048_c0_g1_i1:259-948(+)